VPLLLLVAGATACSTTPPTITPAPDAAAGHEAATLDPSAEQVTVDVLNSQVAVGLERVAFDMTDAQGMPADTGSDVDLVFYKVSELEPGQNRLQRAASGNGPWYFDVTVTGGDGTISQGRGEVDVSGRIDTPRLGQQAPTTDTPRLGVGVELADLTTDPKPIEVLYEMSVGEALDTGKPTLVYFGSPEHCDTDDCAATLLQVQKIMRQQGEAMNIIHIESRDLADPEQLSATAVAWGLPSDPWTFLFDGRGFLVARVEGPVDHIELGLLIDQMVQ
jgi:hypothetical protein